MLFCGLALNLTCFFQSNFSSVLSQTCRSNKCLMVLPICQEHPPCPVTKMPLEEMKFVFAHDRIQDASYFLLPTELCIVCLPRFNSLMLIQDNHVKLAKFLEQHSCHMSPTELEFSVRDLIQINLLTLPPRKLSISTMLSTICRRRGFKILLS